MEDKSTTLNMMEFCKSALTLLGTKVTESSGVLSVDIPPSSLDLFEGRSSLRLAFDPECADEDTELIVTGSYTLERLLEMIRQRGSLAHICMSPTVKSSSPPKIDLVNAETRLLSSTSIYQPFLIGNFKVSMVSDEDEDRIFTAVIDAETGKPHDMDTTFLASASVEEASHSIESEHISIGMKSAREMAEGFATKWASSVQAAADARLATETTRLEGYYKDLLADAAKGKNGVSTPRKLENHKARVAAASLDLETKFDFAKEVLSASSTVDELNSQLEQIRSDIIKEKGRIKYKLVLDYYAEMAKMDRKLTMISKISALLVKIVETSSPETRMEELQREREKAVLALQEKWSAKDPAVMAHASAEQFEEINDQLIAEKEQRIAELKDKFHVKVKITPFSAALVSHPKTRFLFDAVSGDICIPFTAYHDLVSDRHELPRCTCCDGEMNSAYACSCGHLTCADCQRSCVACGTYICSSCVKTTCQTCGAVLCEKCVSKCDLCGAITCPTHSTVCTKCGVKACSACSSTCSICGASFCKSHSTDCGICGSTVCTDSIAACVKCGAKGCTIDIIPCASCDEMTCPQHRSPCKICGQPMCQECSDNSEYCSTCKTLFPATSSAAAINQILRELKGVTPDGRWIIGENSRQFVLAHKGIPMVVYVIDKSTFKLQSEHRLGLADSIIETLRSRR